ncbi:hypothetical protein NPA11_02475 [Mycoplasma sp. 1578d]|nr:hypothetical protein [Mycoplasma sp. 1578d]UUM19617.1 hypothetical protein NPA11_02475 [Mycoplasma sp. 1578d]
MNLLKNLKNKVEELKKDQIELLSNKSSLLGEISFTNFLKNELEIQTISKILNLTNEQTDTIKLLLNQFIENKTSFTTLESKKFDYLEQKIKNTISQIDSLFLQIENKNDIQIS